jgi:hypothetical protein
MGGMSEIKIGDNYKDYMFGLIESICEKIGPREPGSSEELRAADVIEEEFKKHCDTTSQESFECHPEAFLGFIKYSALLTAIGLIAYWSSFFPSVTRLPLLSEFNLTLTCLILSSVSALLFWKEFLNYDEFVDPLFPKKSSKNVIGVINPAGEVKKTVIFSGHHDSAYEFNLWYIFKSFGVVLMLLGIIVLFSVLVVSLFRVINCIHPFMGAEAFFYAGVAFAFLIPLVAANFKFHSHRPVLGAFDNLSAVAIVSGIGKYLRDNRGDPKIFPKNTRVLLISFGCEEAGLRGSRRYVETHSEELRKAGAICVNMDGIGQKEKIKIVTRELSIGARHSPEVYEGLMQVTQQLGITAECYTLPFGASDAASFSFENLPAASIFAVKASKLPEFYHTRLDTPKIVEKEALEKVMRICLGYLKRIDG